MLYVPCCRSALLQQLSHRPATTASDGPELPSAPDEHPAAAAERHRLSSGNNVDLQVSLPDATACGRHASLQLTSPACAGCAAPAGQLARCTGLHIAAGTALRRHRSASGLQAAAQWVETSCPFLGLLLVVFFQQHFQGEAVCIPSNAAWGDCVVASTPQDALILAKPLQHNKPLLRFGCNMAF